MKLTGAQIIWETLIQQGSTTVFGYPGGAILPAYDALYDYSDRVKHVLVRHEENAALAADSYFRATGKVGVCMATSGPGATNLVTGLANAMLDSSAVVAITGQVASHLVGSDAFQETDICGITLPITKHNFLVTDINELAPLVLGPENHDALDFILGLKDRGISLDSLHTELLEPTARHLGELWDEDKIDFLDVTLGVARLQRLVFVFEGLDQVPGHDETRKVLLATAPGEQHSLGSSIVQKFLRAAGWHVWTCATPRREDATSTMTNEAGIDRKMTRKYASASG